MLGTDLSLTFVYSYAHEWAYKGLTNLFHGRSQGVQEREQPYTKTEKEKILPAAQIEAVSVQAHNTIEQVNEMTRQHG